MKTDWKKSVLARVTPSKQDAALEQKMVRSLIRKINASKGPHVGAVLAGSLARNTHLRGDRDLDIFVFYSPSLKRERFEKEGLKLGRAVFGKHFHEEAYSEHPYIRGSIDGFNVEIVPTFKVAKASEKLSAVDRTPFHASYMKKKLSTRQCNDVRLLKQFFKGISVYGADVRYQGVPGYLVEILILKYGTFEKALLGISQWNDHTVIDLERAYGNDSIALSRFHHPFLLVVDPTDASRNVAGALSYNQFARAILASRMFMKKPSEKFFFGLNEKPLSTSQIKSYFSKEELIGIHIPYPEKVLSDVVWGQLNRISTKLLHALEQYDFCIRRSWVWTDGQSDAYVVFDVENPILPKSKLRMGPKVVEQSHVEKFLAAHKQSLSGPRVENGKVVIEVTRSLWKFSDALLAETKKAVPHEKEEMKHSLGKAVLVNEAHMVKKASSDKEFLSSLSVFLKGKEPFL